MISKPKLVAMIIASAFFMQNLDSTIVATALPQIAISFKTNPVRLSSVITSYLLAAAVFLPISGWLADRYGGSYVFRAAIAIFTLGSILCGISNGVLELTVARVIQGMGGAMMIPVGRLVLLRSITKAEMVEVMVYMMVPSQIGQVIGPPVGGWITTYASWRWIFLMNIPIGLLGAYLATRYIANYKEGERHKLDWVGFLLTGVALTSLLYAIESVRGKSVDWLMVGGFFVTGLVMGGLSVRHLRRHPHPIVDLSLLELATFRVSFWGGTPVRLAFGATRFLLPLLFQVALGMSAFASGLLIFASAIGNVLMKTTLRFILKRFGFRTALAWNTILVAATTALCCIFTSATPLLVIFAVLFAGGFFQSLHFTGMNTLAFADVPAAKMSTATSLTQVGSQISSVFGVSMAALVLQGALAWRGSASLAPVDFEITFGLLGILTLITVPALMTLSPDAGAELSGKRAAG